MKTEYFLFSFVMLLFAIGILMVFDTTSAEVIDRGLNISTHHALIKQLSYGCLGALFALLVYFFGHEKLLKMVPWLFWGTTCCLVLVFVPGMGRALNGAHRWMFLGSCSFQPSELIKVVAPLYFISLYLKVDTLSFKSFCWMVFKLSIPLVLIFIEPDNGAVAIMIVVLMALFFLCAVPSLYWLFPFLFLAGVVALGAFQMPYVKQRIQIYLHPELDLLGRGHQPYQARIATGSGRLFGRGIGASMQKLNYLPEARSDYIAAIYAEEFGFLGILFLVFLYLSIAYTGLHIALNAETKAGLYIASIMTFSISFQAFLNLGVVSGLLPSKGTNLPFFSQGGSSLLANSLAIALIMSARKASPDPLKNSLGSKKGHLK